MRALALTLLVLMAPAFGATKNLQSAKLVRVSEMGIRRAAIKIVMPTFPEVARKRGASGVAVAELEFNAEGAVIRLQILESPDPVIKVAVAEAVQKWKFQPQTLNGEPVNIVGKLTFYYLVDGRGGGRVENPKQIN
jgi:TonB family protein